MSVPVADQSLPLRLEATGIAYVSTSELADLPMNGRNKKGVITPADAEKTSTLIFEGFDEGRFIKGALIVNTRLRITHRVNLRSPSGAEAVFEPELKALESLLDANLTAALNAPALGIAVMLATRQPGRRRRRTGDIQETHYEIEAKCVAMENTTDGLAG